MRLDAGGEEAGATLLLDGRRDRSEDGFFIGPTILDHVTGDMDVCREEIFGPVLCIARVSSLSAAVELANGSRFGNACGVFTESGGAARYVREHLDAGMIGINVGVPAPMAFFPFNGIKQSFYGDLHATGKDGVRFFTENRVEVARWHGTGELYRLHAHDRCIAARPKRDSHRRWMPYRGGVRRVSAPNHAGSAQCAPYMLEHGVSDEIIAEVERAGIAATVFAEIPEDPGTAVVSAGRAAARPPRRRRDCTRRW